MRFNPAKINKSDKLISSIMISYSQDREKFQNNLEISFNSVYLPSIKINSYMTLQI